MKILPIKLERVTDELRVFVSNHFVYSDFGVRQSGEMRYYGRRYVSPYTPGTGFIEHDSESHSYHQFVRDYVAWEKPNYWRLLLGKEPDYDSELRRAKKVLDNTEKGQKREILECYVNALSIGRVSQRMEKITRAVRKRMHNHHSKKLYVSVVSHYKSRIAQLGHDMSSVEYHLKDHYSPEVLAAYEKMVTAFVQMMSCRRIWCLAEGKRNRYKQVFFDLGIFDFIRSNTFLPIMRDAAGVHYYILPDCIVVARSSTDFDLVPLKTLTVVSQEMAIEESIEVVSSQLGDAASMIRIPELNLTFYFNHVRTIVGFVHELNELKKVI